jgi:hypothetical protein
MVGDVPSQGMRRALAVLAALAAVVPAAAAGPTVTPLYATLGEAPGAPGWLQVIEPGGEARATGGCDDDLAATASAPRATWVLPFSPGEFAGTRGEGPTFRDPGGLRRDLEVGSLVLRWWVSFPDDTHLGTPFQVHADVLEGWPATWTHGPASARLLASGSTPPGTAGRGLHAVELPLALQHGSLGPAGFTLVVRLEDDLDCLLPEERRAASVTDPDHRARLDVASAATVTVDSVHATAADGWVTVQAGLASAFGAADIDPDAVRLQVAGPSEARSVERILAQPPGHELTSRALEATWLWRFRADGAEPGNYTFTVTLANRAGTSEASGAASLAVTGNEPAGGEGPRAVPVPGALAILAIAAAARSFLRRVQ